MDDGRVSAAVVLHLVFSDTDPHGEASGAFFGRIGEIEKIGFCKVTCILVSFDTIN